MKERYNVAPWNDGKDAVCKAEDGKYILYTDHLAEIREIVDTYDLLIDRCDKTNSELEAENKRLAALNDMFPPEIARLEDRVSEEYEAERADDRARIQELEAERDAAVRWLEEYKSKTYCAYCGATFNIDSDAAHVTEHIRTCPHHPMRELEAEVGRLQMMNPCNHTGFESAPCDVCGYPDPRKLIAKLKAENRRLRELVDGATVAVELFKDTAPAQKKWREEWLNKAREALKEVSHG